MSKFLTELDKHKNLVETKLNEISDEIRLRAITHDNSKYLDDEKVWFEKAEKYDREHFDTYEDWLNTTKPIIAPALEHHYAYNRHHPEHYKNGINDMNLIDLIEMVVDWQSSAECRNTNLDAFYSFKRFKIEPQLQKIILNTLKFINEEKIKCLD